MTFLIIIGMLLGVILLYLVGIVFLPFIKVKEQPISLNGTDKEIPSCRENIVFEVDGLKLSGWLYLPDGKSKPVGCVVLTQGFCGTKDMLLEKYALRFTEAGFAALTFDYRHFGESEGDPRQLYSLTNQLKDIKAAVQYARSREEINTDKIFIWGTSSSGNYGVLVAAEDPNIAGIIGQSPSFDHQADGKRIVKRDGMTWFLNLIFHAQRDKGRSRLGLSPHKFPVAGLPGSTAMFIAPGAYEGYKSISQDSSTFKNEVCARLMFDPHGPDLLKSSEKVKCPALFQICENDDIMAPDSHHKIAGILGERVEIIMNPIGHFDIYFSEYFEKSVREQIKFLKR